MKNHLKRIASPRTWIILRKENTFITRPNPGGHPLDQGLALGTILRDELKLASTMREIKKVLENNEILVDGKRRKDHRYLVGLFDVITIPLTKKAYRLWLDQKGRIIVAEIKESESKIKPCKIVGKTMLAGKKIQFHLHDGKNLIADLKAKVGDTLILSLPKLEVKEVFALQPGAAVFLTKGKHSGDSGTLKELKGGEAVYLKGKEKIETAKDYIFVLGKDKPIIELKMTNQ
ncbi:MAG TPA: 30S ribosomal protein S4e [Candidatus Nanoarchaeia archaeon]|nr:30S ribosomal protein S4e [Candidatus Nanoarchaeia archaeon]